MRVGVWACFFLGSSEITTMSGAQQPSYQIDFMEVLSLLIKYMAEGLVVAIAAYTLPSQEIAGSDIVQISMIAMCTFSILDFFAPRMSKAARMGAGAGIGANLVGFPRPAGM